MTETEHRCPDCGMPDGMHHNPGCSHPCGPCKRAKWRGWVRDAARFMCAASAGAALVHPAKGWGQLAWFGLALLFTTAYAKLEAR
jgi:hypothetical protein